MGEVVNLNRARKARTRAADQAHAAQNRVRHGRSKAERTAGAAEAERSERRLDGHQREP